MTKPFIYKTALTMTILTFATACGSDQSNAQAQPEAAALQAQSPQEATLEVATALGVNNARMPMPHLVTAGQPTEEQLQGLADAGFENFISLRVADENGAGWEEARTAGAPFSFKRLPISSGEDLTRENVEALTAMLEAAGDEPTVLYCGSSNRVGAMLALKAFWMDGVDAEAALELGKSAGMTRLEGQVRELMGLEAEG